MSDLTRDPRVEYDAIVLGGGLAGLCLAIQLKQESPDIHLLVLEQGGATRPEAAHKVGESSVEMASHYFRNVIGVTDLLEKEIPKFGLRFFMSQGKNGDISQRFEFGPKNFLTMPSHQIDRGQFENGLVTKAVGLGIQLVHEAKIINVAIANEQDSHTVRYACDGETTEVSGRWVVDASGRRGFLKKLLKLSRPILHNVNAAWFRLDHSIDLDDWSEDPTWRSRVGESRRLSTNHLMGEGYWVWLIPLAAGRTSIGIVAEDGLHPFKTISTFDKSMAWLEEHEPQCASIIREHEDKRLDFLALKHYSHNVKQMFSQDRWCLTGDAGIFIDPLYSPGSDFIGMANGFICDLIQRDLRGEEIDEIASMHDIAYRSIAQTYLFNYQRQYPLMGRPRIMVTKIIWDFAMYWGGVAMIFCRGRLCDPSFMDKARPILQGFAFANISMQALFRKWAKMSAEELETSPRDTFISYDELPFLAELNANLNEKFDDDELLAQLTRNLMLAENLKLEIIAEANRDSKRLIKKANSPATAHLKQVFEDLL